MSHYGGKKGEQHNRNALQYDKFGRIPIDKF
jgi:hypothetical protein